MTTRREFLIGGGALVLAGAQVPLLTGSVRGDIAILRNAYETMHPGLYRYAQAAEVARRFSALEAAWSRDQSLIDAYLSLSRFLATIRCGHSYANFYNQNDAVAAALFAGQDKLPFLFRWIGGRMIVTAHGGDVLPPGSEIVSIDGLRAGDILSDLLPFTRADGSNDAKRVAQLQVRGIDGYETFDIFYALTRGRPGRTFEVAARTAAGAAVRVTLSPIDLAQRRAQRPQTAATKDAPKWTLAFDGEVARLIMPDWAVYNSKWDWMGFLDASFDEIMRRGARALIVDLRGNEGGLDCGDEILARCIDEALPRAAYERRVRFQKAPAALDPYLDTWDPSFKDWGGDAQPVDGGFFRLIERDGATRASIAPKGPRFKGRLVVVTDATNSSATFQFANLVQANKLGVLVGSPTGGNLRGINGGAFFFLRLPASGLEVDLPLIGTFPATPQPDTGIVPDVLVAESTADIAAGRDAVLARALEVARAI